MAFHPVLQGEHRRPGSHHGPDQGDRFRIVVGLDSEKDEIHRPHLAGIGGGLDIDSKLPVMVTLNRQTLLLNRFEVLPARDQNNFMIAPGQHTAEVAPHSAGSHHRDSHGLSHFLEQNEAPAIGRHIVVGTGPGAPHEVSFEK